LTAILLGIVAALSWGVSAASAARVSRGAGANVAIAFVQGIGLLIVLPVTLLASGFPHGADHGDWFWGAVAGVGAVTGLGCYYAALTTGKIGIVAVIVNCDGALAAVIAILAGEAVGGLALAALALVATGVVVTTAAPDDGGASGASRRRAIALAATAATVFATSLYSAGRAVGLGALWVVLCARIAGVAGLTLPAALRGGLRVERALWPYVLVSGVLESGGYLAYVYAARDGIAIAAVLVSQSALVTAIIGVVALHERLNSRQIAGIGLALVGLAALAAAR
jgi:drug/metabolite transporter (DMT)-like permease